MSKAIQDLEYGKFADDGSVKVTGTLNTGDIEIGAVEIKNGSDDTRATVTARGLQVEPSGAVADNAADSGNPVKVGGIYQGTAQTYSSGDRYDLQGDINGNTKVTQATAMAGEDLTNDVLKTEQRFSYYHHVGTAGAVLGTVKSGAGFLHCLTLGGHTAGGTYTLYDSIGTSATVIGIISSAGAVSSQYIYDVSFATGLTISSGSVADLTISYR